MSRRGGGGFLEFALEAAEAIGPRVIVYNGLEDALTTMENMIANEGQQAAYDEYVKNGFRNQGLSVVQGTDYEWADYDAGYVMDFVGEIVEEGNNIMTAACEEATAAEEAIEAAQIAVFVITRGAVGDLGDIVQDFFD